MVRLVALALTDQQVLKVSKEFRVFKELLEQLVRQVQTQLLQDRLEQLVQLEIAE
jgi:hypothetical protein